MKNIAILIKWRIALLSAVSAAAGALLAAPDAGWRLLWPLLGTYLLACGAGALNQIQERDLDARMPRTQNRPLPSGAMTLRFAWLVVVAFLGAGLGLLALTGSVACVALGAVAVISYNAFYTPLKRITPWAPVIGSIVGAFAPAIGWTGVGGEAGGPALVGLIAFFVVWQVPHFWLLFLRAEREYAAAGLPVLTDKLHPASLKRITFVWIAAAVALGLLLPLLGAIHHVAAVVALAAVGMWLAWTARGILSASIPAAPRAERRAFAAINAFATTLLAAIIFEQAWRPGL